MFESRKIVMATAPVILLAVGLLVLFYRSEKEDTIQIAPANATPRAPQAVKVHVIGAVRSPGIYQMKDGDRVDDAIRVAGGPISEADLQKINLAAKLRDGQQLKVPAVGEAPDQTELTQQSGTKELDINSASSELLDTLPGIGPTRSQAIVESRLKAGLFKDIRDLVSRKLLPQSVFEQVKDKIVAR